ncbi:MAG: hypothetical protein ACKOCV_05545 [Gemmatimonadota bacterium]
MRLELAERLRCPGVHAPTPLIVVAQETVARDLRRAIVGCAVCGLEARLAAGVLTFPDGLVVAGVAGAEGAARAGRPEPSVAGAAARAGDDAAAPAEVEETTAALERLVALLHLDGPGGAVLLAGRYARFAAALEVSHEVHAVVLASARDARDARHTREVPRRAEHLKMPATHDDARAIPFTDATFRAAAVEAMPPALLDDLARVVTTGGRIVASVGTELPAGTRVLARDDREWVAEREGVGGGVVVLKKARS